PTKAKSSWPIRRGRPSAGRIATTRGTSPGCVPGARLSSTATAGRQPTGTISRRVGWCPVPGVGGTSTQKTTRISTGTTGRIARRRASLETRQHRQLPPLESGGLLERFSMNPRLPCADCASCTLARDSWNGPVPMDGDKEPDIIFVGEAPGIEEVRAKKPFAGVSGKLLRGLVSYFNRVHEDRYGKRLRVAYTNVVACRPPGNRDPSTAEIEACSGRLRHELSQYPNARIVGLGRFAIKALGVRRELKEVDGCWIETHRGPVLASYHPAYILRQPGQFSAFKHGIGQAFEPEIRLLHMPKANYTIIECEADLKALKFEDDLVAVDIETTGFD